MVEDLRHGEILELKKRHPYRSGLLKHAENSSAVPRICAPNAQPPQVRAGEAKRSGPDMVPRRRAVHSTLLDKHVHQHTRTADYCRTFTLQM